MKDKVYKILREEEWLKFQDEKVFKGTSLDLQDGFIHLSTKDQVAGVIERYFSGIRPLYLAEFSNPGLIQSLKWEKAKSGEVYPHLYQANLEQKDVSNFEIIT